MIIAIRDSLFLFLEFVNFLVRRFKLLQEADIIFGEQT
jgi:hypothetical protein